MTKQTKITEEQIRERQDYLNMGSDTHTYTREEAIRDIEQQ